MLAEDGGGVGRQPSLVLSGKHEDLAGMNEIWILDPVPISPVDKRVACAIAVGDAADPP